VRTPDHYEILGVSRDASTEEIERARKNQARYWHPDRNKQADAAHHFDAVQKAAEVLRDPRLRAAYDRDFALRAAMSIPRDRPRPEPESEPATEPFHVPPIYVAYAHTQPEHAQAGHAQAGNAEPHGTRPRARRDPRKAMLLAGLAVVVAVASTITAFAIHKSADTPAVKSPATGPVAGTGPASPAPPGPNPGTLTLPQYSSSQAELPVSNGQVLTIGPTIALLSANGLPLWHENASVNSLNSATAASGGPQTRSCAVASGAAGRDYDFISLLSGQQAVVAADPPAGGSFALAGDAVALPDGTIRDPCTGAVTGRAAPRGTFTSTECLLGTMVIGTGRSGQMAWQNGHRLWQIRTRNRLICNNHGSVVMLNPAASKISYLNPANGKTRWTVKDPTCARGCLSHSAAVHLLGEAPVVILTDANQVLALNHGNGGVLWQKSGECALQARVTPSQAVLLGPCGSQSADGAVATVANPSSGATIGTHQVSLTGCGPGSEWTANSHRLLVVCPDPAATRPTDRASLIAW
jgi:outer membrane protein assembly factor BamB